MSKTNKGVRLWLRPASRDATGKIIERTRWIIKDGERRISTGCGAETREEAEKRLANHIASKYAPERRVRALSEIKIADIVAICLFRVAPRQADFAKAVERAERLPHFFGAMSLDEINAASCRTYVVSRAGQGRAHKGSSGGARRNLQDLAAAINYHRKQGLHRESVFVEKPCRGRRASAG
jgi:hypothetical protein